MDSQEIYVSFCITCKGRLHHLQRTLPENLCNHRGVLGVEFVLLNYSSPDGLHDWVKSNLTSEIEAGIVNYYKTEGYKYYVPAHAKNVAHRLARGRITCNLDADNFTGPNFADYLIGLFRDHSRIYFQPTHAGGAAGRIAMLKKDFEDIGGYDERLQFGWGQDDIDLTRRASAIGLAPIGLPQGTPFAKVLEHKDLDRIRFTRVNSKKESQEMHRKLSKESVARGEFVANVGRKWGAAKVEKNFRTELES